MPYIKPENRVKYNKVIAELFALLKDDCNEGDINYVMSSVFWKLFEHKKSYATANKLIGVLECIKAEFYRRKVAIYEDSKIMENGDIVDTQNYNKTDKNTDSKVELKDCFNDCTDLKINTCIYDTCLCNNPPETTKEETTESIQVGDVIRVNLADGDVIPSATVIDLPSYENGLRYTFSVTAMYGGVDYTKELIFDAYEIAFICKLKDNNYNDYHNILKQLDYQLEQKENLNDSRLKAGDIVNIVINTGNLFDNCRLLEVPSSENSYKYKFELTCLSQNFPRACLDYILCYSIDEIISVSRVFKVN